MPVLVPFGLGGVRGPLYIFVSVLFLWFVLNVRVIRAKKFMIRCFFQDGGAHRLRDYVFREVQDICGVLLIARTVVSAGHSQVYVSSIYYANRDPGSPCHLCALGTANCSEDKLRKILWGAGREFLARVNVVLVRWDVHRLRRLRANRPGSSFLGANSGFPRRSSLRNAKFWRSRNFLRYV